jgi:hypothetical protein
LTLTFAAGAKGAAVEVSEFPRLNFRETAFKDGVVPLADINEWLRSQCFDEDPKKFSNFCKIQLKPKSEVATRASQKSVDSKEHRVMAYPVETLALGFSIGAWICMQRRAGWLLCLVCVCAGFAASPLVQLYPFLFLGPYVSGSQGHHDSRCTSVAFFCLPFVFSRCGDEKGEFTTEAQRAQRVGMVLSLALAYV